jgi:hypothetical protein
MARGPARAVMTDPGLAMNRRLLLPWLLSGANAALALAAWTRQPWANGPAEWRWEYLRPGGLAAGGATGAVLAAALAGLGLLWGHRRLAAWRGALPLAVACGAAFTFALVAAQPGGWARVAAALVSRNGFGYVWDAALAPPAGALLADYPAASAGLNQHSLTHPPGALLAARALGRLDRVLPAPKARGAGGGGPGRDERRGRSGGDANDGLAVGDGGGRLPELAAAAIAREVQRARAHGRPVPQPPPGPWAVTALALLLPALSALAAWPLYLLARRWGWERRAALLAAVLWLLAPARSLFTPSLDQALPALLVSAAWLAADGRWTRAAAAGALLFAACFLSYGCLAALPLVAACAAVAGPPAPGRGEEMGAADGSFQRPGLQLTGTEADLPLEPGRARTTDAAGSPQRPAAEPTGAATALRQGSGYTRTAATAAWQRWGSLALGFALPYLVLAVAAGHDPWHALRTALALHHRIAVATRSYAAWLLWNPYDFALLLSPAVLGLAAAALSWRARWRLAAFAWWGSLGLLLLSGGVRGEVGRIWLIWMPFACLFAAGAAAHRDAEPANLATIGDPGAPATHPAGWQAGVAWVLATEALLTLALGASMVFVT